MQRKNVELLQEVRTLECYWYGLVALILLLIGGFFGASWEKRNLEDTVSGVQQQIEQLRQIIKTPLIPPSASVTRKSEKKRHSTHRSF